MQSMNRDEIHVGCSRLALMSLQSYYKVGDRVRAIIVKINEETNKISLGLKKKYFEDEGQG